MSKNSVYCEEWIIMFALEKIGKIVKKKQNRKTVIFGYFSYSFSKQTTSLFQPEETKKKVSLAVNDELFQDSSRNANVC